MPTLNPYKGVSRKLVLAIDIGTTYSGVSYSILDPGVVPEVYSVTRYPGQTTGDAKIPSIICYRKDGSVRAVGAEAADETIYEEEGLYFVEWFKMHLMPASMFQKRETDVVVKPLPDGKTVVDVFADVLTYLFSSSQTFIEESHPSGDILWRSVENNYEVILTHPNGWGGNQQAKMREAAILARLVPDTVAGSRRLTFLTEGEASMNYCISAGTTEEVMSGTSVIVVDAGGGTVDISAYYFKETEPLALEETAPAECLLHGSTTVNMLAEKLLRSKLANSNKFNEEEFFAKMMKSFEFDAKRGFKNQAIKSYIRLGKTSDNDKSVGISAGQISLAGTEMANLFKPSVNAIMDAIKSQCGASSGKITRAFLVGGFAASPYLFSQLQTKLGARGIKLSLASSPTNKAVADGAIWHYLGGFVVARTARCTFGTDCVTGFDIDDPKHRMRLKKAVPLPTGTLGLPDAFSPLLIKGTKMREDQICAETFNRMSPLPIFRRVVTADIFCYRGKQKCPSWLDEEPDAFTTMCTVEADTSDVDIGCAIGRRGPVFTQEFDVVLECGKTEMKAYLRWMEDGVEKRGDAKIVYQDDSYGNNADD